MEVDFEGAALPGSSWRPEDVATARPTLFVVWGNDDTIEEDVFVIGHAAVQRGFNVSTVSYAGPRNTVHTDPAQ